MSVVDELFPGFVADFFDIGRVTIHARFGGSGPPLLLLHGYPQTHAAWHKVASELARTFTIVLPDLRGYGHSSCPPDDVEHRAYSKRTMAADVAQLMRDLGHSRFLVMGHDRGGRVAYRLALDQPDLVERLVIVDIMSTWDNWEPEHLKTRQRISHWAFLAQPAPIPESLIGDDPIAWLEGRFRRGTLTRTLTAFDQRALEEYRVTHADPDHIHAACEDYRAGAGCDLADDEVDRRLGRRIACPTRIVWGRGGSLADVPDPLALWRRWCSSLSGCAIESGHYIPEENPAALLEAVLPFLNGSE
jgi:haloacetate dehalogenase